MFHTNSINFFHLLYKIVLSEWIHHIRFSFTFLKMIGKFPTQVKTTTVQVDVELSRTLWRDTTCLSSPMHGAVGLGMVTTCLPKAKDGHQMCCSTSN